MVREIAPPKGVAPLSWLLLTTHPVTSVAAALEIVAWYRRRWLIEQLFRILKTQGFNVEDSQIADGAALMKADVKEKAASTATRKTTKRQR